MAVFTVIPLSSFVASLFIEDCEFSDVGGCMTRWRSRSRSHHGRALATLRAEKVIAGAGDVLFAQPEPVAPCGRLDGAALIGWAGLLTVCRWSQRA